MSGYGRQIFVFRRLLNLRRALFGHSLGRHRSRGVVRYLGRRRRHLGDQAGVAVEGDVVVDPVGEGVDAVLVSRQVDEVDE